MRGRPPEGGFSATGSNKALKAFGRDSEEEPKEGQMGTDAFALVAITQEALSWAPRVGKEAGGEIDDCSRNNSGQQLLDSRMLDKADDCKTPVLDTTFGFSLLVSGYKICLIIVCQQRNVSFCLYVQINMFEAWQSQDISCMFPLPSKVTIVEVVLK